MPAKEIHPDSAFDLAEYAVPWSHFDSVELTRSTGHGIAAIAGLAIMLSGCAAETATTTVAPSPTAPVVASTHPPARPRPTAAVGPTEFRPDSGANALVTWEHRPISKVDLDASTRARWFFGHQSVGGNVLKGVNALYKANGLGKSHEVDLKNGGSLPGTGGFIAHAHVGRNGHPLEKLADFDRILRGGVAANIDAAVLKFCYSDVREGRVDVPSLFEEYTQVMSALERDYPDVTFLYATVPLKADTVADNVARTEMNAMIRTAFAESGRLWDIAAIESTTPDGEPVGGTHGGQPYQALHSGFTKDGGHLYTIGTEVAAAPLLQLVVRAAE